ncbi:SDR family oxidoreductase [Leptospira wolffii]|uniref:3-dehydrosphinganine reductase n=1 Tax=Leptospira wolffii TaxID=409998 RepID=A0ABV5BM69_9LEPT|nr:SDR family oxidoreductase [Leptospira wolffii]TGL50832.1 SDR family NAD(P)-dependent oxidoreductase [Leptospira wolffii]
MSKNYYRGKKAFITGGSSGIGKGLAIALAEEGADVFLCARNESLLKSVTEELRSIGPNSRFGYAVADVSDKEQIEKAAKKALDNLGKMDLVICNSGFAQAAEAQDLSESQYRKMMDVNYFGHVNTALAFHKYLTGQGSGDIVFLSSTLAFFSIYGYGAYSASKFAIAGFAQAFRQEMMLHGVKVKLFFPPTTDTPGLAKENEDKPLISKEIEMGSALNKVHSVESVAKGILKWIPNRKFIGYTGWDSWLQYFLFRHFPEWSIRITDSELRGAQDRLLKKAKN